MKFYKTILIFLVFLLLVSSVNSETLSANQIDYVYNQLPELLVIGSNICYDSVQDEICAPIISFDIGEEISSTIITLNLNESVDISGTACLLDDIEYHTWNAAMLSLTDNCVNFNSQNNAIEFEFPYELSSFVEIILIPNSGSGNTNVLSANLDISNELPTEEPEPPEVPPQIHEPFSKCYINSISVDKSQLFAYFPVNLLISTTDCLNSEIKIYVKKTSSLNNEIVSQSQFILSSNSKEVVWIPEETGTYVVSVESENTIQSSELVIKNKDINLIADDKDFFEVIENIHSIADYDKSLAIEQCASLNFLLQRSSCFQDLALYLDDKTICMKVESQERRESCYSAFALDGDVTSCLHTEDKANCIMLSSFMKTSDISFNPYENIDKSEIILAKYKSNNLNLWPLLIYCILIFILILSYKKLILIVGKNKIKRK